MTLFSWKIGDQGGGATRSCVGFFLKPQEAPASAMTLLDIDAGAAGYWRFVLQADHTVVLEVALALSGGGTWGTTVTSPALPLGAWSWITGDQVDGSKVNLGITSAGGTVWSSALTGGSLPPDQSYAARVGWGTSYSSGDLGFFDSDTGGEMSKLWFSYGSSPGTANTVALAMPLVDPDPTGQVALYLCRETPGVVATLADATSNHFDLTAVGSLIVNADGPYTP